MSKDFEWRDFFHGNVIRDLGDLPTGILLYGLSKYLVFVCGCSLLVNGSIIIVAGELP